MKRMKELVATLALAGVILMGATSANAGVMISDFAGGDKTNPCSETKFDKNVNYGIIVSGLTGIIVSGLTGIIVSGFSRTVCEVPQTKYKKY